MSSNQTNNAFKTQKSQTSPFFTIAIALMHLFALVLLVAFVGIGLIAVYHTVILLVSKALPLLTTFVVPSVTLVLAVGVHYLKQPTHNLLCLIAVFFMTVFLYLRVGAEFLGFLFLIVYVGAIAILFLFVIMLLNLKKQDLSPKHSLGFNRETLVRFSVLLPIAGLDDIASTEIAKFFIISDVVSMKTENNSVDAVAWYISTRFSDIMVFSENLYTYHAVLFVMAGTLLLTAMLGAIILATSATDHEETTA